MPLTNVVCKNAKPKEKAYKLSDAQGMYLEVQPNGSRYWRMKYRFGGKEKRLALGVYPEVSLTQARDKRSNARKLLASDIDPAEQRKAVKSSKTNSGENSFEAVAREWFGKFAPNWATSHSSKIIRRLEKDVFPWLGSRPIAEITAPDLLTCFRRVESRGAIETAHRVHQNCGQIFRYAVATGRAERDPSADLRGAIPPAKVKHHASIVPPRIRQAAD